MKFKFIALLVISAAVILPAGASNPPFITDCPDGPGPGCNDESSGSDGQQGVVNKSFEWTLNLGVTEYTRSNNFQSYSRVGAVEGSVSGGMPRSLDSILSFYKAGGLQNRQQLRLRLSADKISAALADPANFTYNNDAKAEIIELNGFLNQAMTDSAFTHVDKLADGFQVRIWSRNSITATTKVNNLYPIPSETPISHTTFTNPDHPADNNKLDITVVETFGTSSRTTTQRREETISATTSLPETLTIKTYQGTVDTGTLLKVEELTYANRGAKIWDYSIERKVWTANTTADGTVTTPILTPTLAPAFLTLHNYETYKDFSTSTAGGEPGARRQTSNIRGYGISGVGATNYTYIDTPTNPLTHGRLQSITKPNGSWEYHEYVDSEDTPTSAHTKYSSWKDVTMANREDARKVVTTVESGKITKTTSIAGQEISKMEMLSTTSTAGESLITTKNWDGNGWFTSTNCRHPQGASGESAGRLKWEEHSDGTATTYAYATVDGFFTITISKGAGDRDGITAGTKTVQTMNTSYVVIDEKVTDIETGIVIDSWTGSNADNKGRNQRIDYNDGTYSQSIYSCCGVGYTTSRTGATAEYFRDALKRVYRVKRKRSSGGTAVDTTTAYNGLTTTTHRSVGTTTLLISETTRTLGGLTTTTKSPDANEDSTPETTTHVMAYNAGGGTTTTVTYPDTTTTSNVTFTDGSMKSSTDQESHTTTYDKGTHAEQGGGLWMKTITPNTDQWTTTYSDHLGRTFKTQFSDGTTETDGAISSATYYSSTSNAGSRGKMASSTDPDGITTSYGYDAEGDRITVSQLSPNGGTRTTTTSHDVVDGTVSGIGPAMRTTTTIEATGTAPQAAVTASTSYRSTDGNSSKSVTLGGTSTSTRSVPDNGEWTVTTTAADGTQTRQYYTDGLMKASVVFETGAALPANAPADITAVTDTGFIAGASQEYDAFGRTLTTTDSRTGVTTIGGYLENGAVTSVTTNGGADTTSYTYDAMGRRIKTILPDSSVTHTRYTARGQTDATWGSQTYARAYTYDALGRMKTLRTKPTLDGSGAPTHAGGSITTWNYDTQRGWLTSKRDATNKGADYTYTAAGRLKTRTWARTGTNTTSGILTTYNYSQGSLASVVYTNDPAATPTVTYTYDAMGRPITVAQGTNTHTYLYDAATLVLDKETISYNGFTRTLDRSQDNLLRPSGFDLKNGTTTEHTASYTYDSASRLATVANGTDTFTYGYQANTYGLLKSVTRTGGHTVTNAYEASRNVLTEKNNHVNPVNPVSKFAYTTNNLGQRTNLTTSGTAFTTAPAYTWTYNAAGELTQADDTSAANNDRAFGYDAIGNRKKSANSLTLPSTDNYTTNGLNQYTAITGLPAGRSHDDDGNMTTGPLPVDQANNATLTWDAENRLVSVAPASGATIYYSYDYLSRRISKQIGAAPATLYTYDGWNLITEYTGTTLTKSYTWGMDLSGSMQGAGGVGGLLSVTDHGSPTPDHFYPTYDGNGNVSEYLDSSNLVQAHYEYDAFGNIVVATGAKKNDFAHRFSTKPLDVETGLYYYGYRYYDPVTGRWPSRDPIKELGHQLLVSKSLFTLVQGVSDLNNYGFVQNMPTMLVDADGRVWPVAVLIVVVYFALEENAQAPGPNDKPVHGPGPIGAAARIALMVAAAQAAIELAENMPQNDQNPDPIPGSEPFKPTPNTIPEQEVFDWCDCYCPESGATPSYKVLAGTPCYPIQNAYPDFESGPDGVPCPVLKTENCGCFKR